MTHHPTPPQTPSQEAQFWLRWNWAWSAFFYLTLLVPMVIVWIDDSIAQPKRLLALALVAAAVLLHTFVAQILVRRMGNLREQKWIALPYILALTLIWLLLANIHPAFNFMLGGLFSQLFLWLTLGWAIPIALLISLSIFGMERGWRFSWQALRDPVLWMWLFVAAAPILLAIFIGAITKESERRQALIQELQATQSELAAAERQAGVLAERQRLAGEIHDTLAQGFTSIVMHLEAAEQAIGSDDATVRKHVDRAKRTARASLEQARRVVNDLMPEPLERASLPEAIARVAAQWSEQYDIPCQTACTGDCIPLSPEIEVILLRAAQEGLNNIAKHARASRAAITLSYMPDMVILDVQDDGVGMDADAPEHGGAGLKAMRRRLAQAGGSLAIESAPDEGTTLVVTIPLAKEADDA